MQNLRLPCLGFVSIAPNRRVASRQRKEINILKKVRVILKLGHFKLPAVAQKQKQRFFTRRVV
jgi:hypothetical protein